MLREIALFMAMAVAGFSAETNTPADAVFQLKKSAGNTAVVVAAKSAGAVTIAFNVSENALAAPGRLLALRDAEGRAVVSLEVRRAGVDPSMTWWDDLQQNYSRWAGPDGSTLVLEAVADVAIAPPVVAKMKKQVRIGAPVAPPGGKPERFAFRFRSGKTDLIVDGKIVDEEWPCGPLGRPIVDLLPAADGRVTEAAVWRAWLDDDALGVKPEPGFETGEVTARAFQYWSPPGLNRWAGDTMLCNDGERLHLLYLSDRRHGASKNVGGHQIAHMSTADLKTWSAHPLAVPITEPWETLGTGNMVKHDGRWFILYGLHTDRVVEGSKTGGFTGDRPLPFDRLPGPPVGAAIASSDDGIHFKKDNVLVGASQNPGVVPDPRGGFAMFAGYGADGLYRSDDLLHWTASDHFLLPFGEAAPTRNSTECFSYFEWNGWHYVIGGRTGFWMSKNFAGPYWDQESEQGKITAKAMRSYFQWRLKGAPPVNPKPAGEVFTPRWDVYDGLWVPMAAAAPGGRRILAGWLEDLDRWAGCLVLRELHQEKDGNLSLSWLPEGVPATGKPLALHWSADPAGPLRAKAGEAVSVHADNLPREFLFEANVSVSAGGYAIVVGGSGDLADGCELRVEPARQRAQWGRPVDGKPAPEMPDADAIYQTEDGRKPVFRQTGKNLPYKGGDFAITHVEGLERAHRVRLLVVEDWKSGSVIVDAELDGRRTMITRRRGLTGNRLQLVAVGGEARFSNITVSPLVR